MAENTAQQELLALLELQGEAVDTQANLEKLQEARTDFVATDPGDADFRLSEALPFMVGAGWIMGPVGGLLVGLAHGILAKKARQNALDRYLADQEVLEGTQDIFHDELERLALSASTPQDIEQLSAMQTEFDSAIKMMASASPELNARGSERLAAAYDRLNNYTLIQEEQAINAAAFDDQLKRQLDEQTYTRHRQMLGDFTQESANFEAQQAAADNILEAVNRGDGASLTAALATLPLLVNPQAGATTDAEVDMWKGIGGTVDSLTGRVLKELGEGGITDDTRKEIIGIARQYKRNTLAYQQAREAWYGERTTVEGIPANLRQFYNISGRLPVVQSGGFVRGEEHRDTKQGVDDTIKRGANSVLDRTTEMIDDISMQINDRIDAYQHERAWRQEFFRIHGVYPADEHGGRIR